MQQQEHVLMDSILQQAKLYKFGKFLISMKSMAGNFQSYNSASRIYLLLLKKAGFL